MARVSRLQAQSRSAQGHRHPACFLTEGLDMPQEAHAQPEFQIPQGTGVSCAVLGWPFLANPLKSHTVEGDHPMK